MARGQLSPGKKRYYLSLNQAKFEQFKAMLKEIGAPHGIESVVIDDFVKGMVDHIGPVLLKIKEEGRNPSFGDFMMMVGGAMNELKDEQLSL